MLRSALQSLAGRVYWTSPSFLARMTGRVAILMYHRVIPRPDLSTSFVQPGMYVTPETFDRHLEFLTAHFHVLSFPELLHKWNAGLWDDAARYAVITFDDGWLDNYRYAYPLLRIHRLPATIFLPTRLIGTDEWLWFDRLGDLLQRRGRGSRREWDSEIERAKSLGERERSRLIADLARELGLGTSMPRRFVDWDEVRDMSENGVTFGSHTRTHASLTRLTGAELDRELREPIEHLQREAVGHLPVLAYPNGDHTDGVVDAARAAGYAAAVTTRAGLESRAPADRFRLKRIGVHEDVSRSAPRLAWHLVRQTLHA
jgi:peptidoglycan/xylan/chitin deacetylase (PgdA/CDA1 family)